MIKARSSPKLVPGKSYLYFGSETGMEHIVGLFGAFDVLVLDANALDVKSARQFVTQAQLGAFGEKRLLLVKNAHLMSEIVQNTLLKLLEEPPPSAVIVLQTEQAQQLLPTVLSRLHPLGFSSSLPVTSQSCFEGSPSNFFTKFTELPRDQLVKLLAKEMNYQQQQLFSTPDSHEYAPYAAYPALYNQTSNRILLLDRVIKKLNANANLKLTIDWLLLRIREASGYTKD